MKRPSQDRPSQTVRCAPVKRWELLCVAAAALAASITAICWSWTHHAFLLYGDAEAHIHIARRLFDSHRPGITQLGSVWLPLPHLILVPFLLVDPWWRNGFAAAVPSACFYVLACVGLYRLARKWLSPAAAVVGVTIFSANPNLLYLQTTAMTEPLFLCELIWAVLLLVDWYQSLKEDNTRSVKLLWAAIAVLFASVYTRYDGWILAFLAWLAMAVCLVRRNRLFRADFVAASVILLLAPAGWMVYNAVVFGDWLDFARGPYSARAIELRTASSAVHPHPGWHNPWVALRYFIKAANMDAASAGNLFALALAGTVVGWPWLRKHFTGSETLNLSTGRSENHESSQGWYWTLLLWLPIPFYAYSVSYGSVPIFIPVWKPFSWYNTRYGMELLPAFALFGAFPFQPVVNWLKRSDPKISPFLIALLLLGQAISAVEMIEQGPLTYVEALKNDESRSYYNTILASTLSDLHTLDPSGIVLMDTGNFPSIVPHAGLTYRQTVNESDKEFYWAALGAPARHADIVLAFAGDEIDKAVHAHPEHLRKYQTFHSGGKGWDQADATIYVTDTFPHPQSAASPSSLPAR